MPDTGEAREIKQRVNAKEAEVVSESKQLLEKVRSTKQRATTGPRGAKKKGPAAGVRSQKSGSWK
jgi:hypothetical protein